ncbi:MAG: isochorismatase family protein, partial [Clostridia bacterium]|nr:isochorismatase family protein [Clostridia bacterium]
LRLRQNAESGGANLDIALCGLCTDICVITNALMLRGHFPEATLRVYADSCAGSSKERHQAALEVLAACHVSVESR